MPALQVRNFPEELYDELREKARRENRSIAQQTIVAVHSYLFGPIASERMPEKRSIEEREDQQRIADRKALFERINSLPRFVVPEGFPTPEELIREDRDSR